MAASLKIGPLPSPNSHLHENTLIPTPAAAPLLSLNLVPRPLMISALPFRSWVRKRLLTFPMTQTWDLTVHSQTMMKQLETNEMQLSRALQKTVLVLQVQYILVCLSYIMYANLRVGYCKSQCENDENDEGPTTH
jgi:hypothetical protein